MKNTFKTIRVLKNGFFPYQVFLGNERKYLFEITWTTSLNRILYIRSKFNPEEILFATIDDKFENYKSTIDAADLYLIDSKDGFPFYFYKEETFYNTEKVVIEDGGLRLKLTSQIIPLHRFFPFLSNKQ